MGRYISNHLLEYYRTHLDETRCSVCLRARPAPKPGKSRPELCVYHLKIWTPEQQQYEIRRFSGQCVYCSLVIHEWHDAVVCSANDCNLLHDQNLEIAREHLITTQPYREEKYIIAQTSRWRRAGIPFTFFKPGLCQLT